VSRVLSVHPQNPQPRLIKQALSALAGGGVIVYPTDSYYALGCALSAAAAVERIRRIRAIDNSHLLTLLCADLGVVGDYAEMDNAAFRVLKSRAPGPYTFVMRASKRVQKRLYHPKRRTIAIRLPANPIARALLAGLDEPMITTTLHLPGDDAPLESADDISERVGKQVDLILDGGACASAPTTVVDFSETPPRLLREGGGAVEEINDD
jgi:tRNA threonylcarbamoyl adenosine modification protein (Sua5/YciO/YrdC/YwlC family)